MAVQAQASHHPFTAEQAEVVRAEWLAGTSTAQIGRLIGRTGASVTGKARRLGMPARPSPIVRRAGQQEVVGTAESQKCLSATRVVLSPLSSPEFARYCRRTLRTYSRGYARCTCAALAGRNSFDPGFYAVARASGRQNRHRYARQSGVVL